MKNVISQANLVCLARALGKLCAAMIVCAPLAACSGNPFWLPPAHKISIQQGNLLSKKQLSRVKVGMSREDVQALIGSPVSRSPFHLDRWDYAFTQGPSGDAIDARVFTVKFEDNVVSDIESNADSTSGIVPEQRRFWEILAPRS